MKAFNKAEALNGAPVVLRNGRKAVVGFEIAADQLINSDIRDALHGYIVGPLNIAENTYSWKEDGRVWSNTENELDIVGMWEEPRKQATINFPSPLAKPVNNGEEYFSISADFEVITFEFNFDMFDMTALESGFMFATREDAQAFLDAMKAARA
nr:MAG TPA: hypothetical protein [Caudoviricetes sp.]